MEVQSETQPLLAPTPLYKNDVPQETYRVLIGWTEDQWSIQARASLITNESLEEHLQAVAACKAFVSLRPKFIPTNLITEIAENELAKTIKARPEFSYAEMAIKKAGGNCRIARVNLRDVLAFQHLVRIDNLQSRLIEGVVSDEQLLELCFPLNQPIDANEVTIDLDDRGYTITVLDPNIRILPWSAIPTDTQSPLPGGQIQYPSASSPLQFPIFPFALLKVPNYLQVVHYQDRYILSHGYTRSASFLYQNIQNVPCLLVETDNPHLVGIKPGMLDLPIMLGDHPPRLSEFWEDAVTCNWQRPAFRKVYRITMEEMNVWR